MGSGGTGAAFGFGVISGFGSIIVNGIQFEDDAASVTEDLGNPRGHSELGLGMVMEIHGSADESTGLGKVTAARIQSELKGLVTSVTPNPTTPGTGEVMVLGTVRATSTTVWQNVSGMRSRASSYGSLAKRISPSKTASTGSSTSVGSKATGKDGGPLPVLGNGSAVQMKFTIAGPGPLKATQIRLDT